MKVVGNYLSKVEQDTLVKEVMNSSGYKKMIDRMRKIKEFDALKYEKVQSLKFDVDPGKGVISAQSIQIKYSEEIQTNFLQKTDSEGIESLILDGFVLDENTKKVVNVVNDSIDELEIDISKVEKLDWVSSQDNKAEESIVPIDPDYYPGILNDKVQAQNPFYSGCLRGGYIYCGVDCGGSIACNSNSKVGINYLDSVCKTHDCCYHTRKVKYKNCYCDSRLCSQAALATNGAAKDIVRAAMCYSC